MIPGIVVYQVLVIGHWQPQSVDILLTSFSNQHTGLHEYGIYAGPAEGVTTSETSTAKPSERAYCSSAILPPFGLGREYATFVSQSRLNANATCKAVGAIIDTVKER